MGAVNTDRKRPRWERSWERSREAALASSASHGRAPVRMYACACVGRWEFISLVCALSADEGPRR